MSFKFIPIFQDLYNGLKMRSHIFERQNSFYHSAERMILLKSNENILLIVKKKIILLFEKHHWRPIIGDHLYILAMV